MSLPENISESVVIVAAVVGVMIVFWVLSTLKGGRKPKSRKMDDITALQAERDALRANHAVEVAALEGKLAEAHARLPSEGSASGRLQSLEGELSDAQAKNAELVGALDDVRGRLGASTVSDLKAALESAKAREADLETALGSMREQLGNATIGDLKAALETAKAREEEATGALSAMREMLGVSTIGDLKAAVETAKAREDAANDSLSKLAYDRDGMQNRIETAERLEREARAEVEKKDTQLELRQQRIYELEAALSGESGDADGSIPLADGAARERIATLEAELETAQRELDALRDKGAASGGDTVQPAITQGDVDELRAAIRELAERFIAASDTATVADPQELSLADRIRAFKVARDADQGS